MAKNILNSSDKSNFILNMTEEQYSKIASVGLISSFTLVSLATLIPELTDKASYSISSIGLIIPGVMCIITAMIAFIRKFIDKKLMFPVIAFAFMVLWGVISLLDSFDTSVSFYGYPQRGEGLLAIIFYFSFFVTAASIKKEKALKAMVLGIMISGWLNSIMAVTQLITKKFNHYNSLSPLEFRSSVSGLSQSPIFLAMVLLLATTAASVTAVTSDSKKMRIFSIISMAEFAFAALNTCTVMGFLAVGFPIIAAAAALFINKAPKIRLLSLFVPVLSGALAVGLIVAGVTSESSKYRLNDGLSLWRGDAFLRISASGDYDNRSVNIDDTYDVYAHLNRKTVDIIKKFPLTGTGPEQLVYPQIYTITNSLGAELANMQNIVEINPGTFDKTYNEYLYTAATKGIPSLIALIAVMLPVLFIGAKNMKRSKTSESAALFFIVLGGAAAFLIGCSNITFAPILWASAGACGISADKVHTAKKSSAKKESANKKNKKN